tara:strand:+ start:395 stop:634 length:240 start_codon:yes stop_codon:yes gene_type:complete
MSIAIGVIELKREFWIQKRLRTINRRDDLLNCGDKVTATAVEFAIDSIQETISDYTDMIKQIEAIEKHQENINKIINNN